MPRKYKPKGGPGGRPPIDDQPIARGVLFATKIEKRPESDVYRAAANLLQQRRTEAAKEANASSGGKRKNGIGQYAARRRIKEIVAAETAIQGNTPLLGLPTGLRMAGDQLAGIARRDGVSAAKAALVQVVARELAWGLDPDPEHIELAQQWLDEVERT